MNVNFNIKLKKKQQEIYDALHDNDNRYVVAVMGRQTGKSVLAIVVCVETLLTVKNANVIYITPTFALGRKIYREIKQALEPTKLIKSANATILTIELTNGSILQFFSGESPNAIRGQTVKGLLVLDEMAYLPEKLPSGEDFILNTVLPITKVHKPKVLCISTPCGKEGHFYNFYLRGKNNEKSYKVVEGSIYDDEYMTEEDINELKKLYPPLVWEQEFLIKFLNAPLTVFKGFEECFIDKIKPIDNQDICWIGLDLSSVGQDRTILTVINKDNIVKQYVIEGTLDQKYKKIGDIINSYPKTQKIYIETNGIGAVMINEIKKYVKQKSKIEEFITTNSSKGEIVGLVQTKIANKEIWFDKENTLLFKEMGTFTYKVTSAKNLTFGAKPGCHDDTVMSLCIATKAKEDVIPLNVQRDVHFVRTRNKNIC